MSESESPARQLAATIRDHVVRLCAAGDRDLGTQRNRDATTYVSSVMRDLGLEVTELAFDVPEWVAGDASVTVGDKTFSLYAGPFSPACAVEGELVPITSADELTTRELAGTVLLLSGEIASVQFTPRGYPFYQNETHAAIVEALETSGAVALIAATGKNPSMTAGMSPFPLVEEPSFGLPSAYMTAEAGKHLASRAGSVVRVRIDSHTRDSCGTQPVGRLHAGGAQRVVVSAHVDSKPGTPGALDNACGVAVLLAAAELVAGAGVSADIEFVPFNGEDHVLAPGEIAYLNARGIGGVSLMINVDAVGLPGAPSAVSLYNADEELSERIESLVSVSEAVRIGEPWPASDHMIFAMQGVPAVALTSSDFETASGVYSHTPLDTPDVPDYELLAHAARFVAALSQTVTGPYEP